MTTSDPAATCSNYPHSYSIQTWEWLFTRVTSLHVCDVWCLSLARPGSHSIHHGHSPRLICPHFIFHITLQTHITQPMQSANLISWTFSYASTQNSIIRLGNFKELYVGVWAYENVQNGQRHPLDLRRMRIPNYSRAYHKIKVLEHTIWRE